MSLFRVIIREYDTFPGHYHEYTDIVVCIVEAASEQQIKNLLAGVESKGLTLLVNPFKPYDLDQMMSAVDTETDGY